MKSNIFFLVFLLIINQVHLYLRGEQREELLAKLAKKVSLETNNLFYEYNDDLYEEGKFQQMTYDVKEILALMEQYNLPQSYNIFEEGIEKDVKNQGSCGCCWSFSSTSALAYRYNKLGEKISLSPQDGVSCYYGKCDGNNLLDPQLNLVKNGTLTEQCFPYKSSDGKTVPECPTTCEDGSEYKKYYAQNAYNIINSQENFKDIVIMIMDQLVTQGPVATGFNLYKDFITFPDVKENCLNKVYTYDGVSQLQGGHAVTIVGYGILDNKIYWLIQNSWDKNWCDSGFIKMEIGQFIEVSFTQPLITSGSKTPVEIEVKYSSQSVDCTLITNGSSIHDWNNTVFVNFENEEKKNNFEFQIGKNILIGNEVINCYFERDRIFYNMKKGIYKFKDFQTYGKDNTFNLNSFKNKQFNYYGIDQISAKYYTRLYLSKVGSKILFVHTHQDNDETLPPMALNGNIAYIIMSKCQHLKTSTKLPNEFAYCEMTQNEINFLQKYSGLVIYRYLCNAWATSQFYLELLDSNYPVFNIIDFYKPEDATKLDSKTILLLTATFTGSVQSYKNDGQFTTIVEIEYENKNTSALAICNATVSKDQEESNFNCVLDINKLVFSCDNIYLLPYNSISKLTIPFEVYIEKEIKAKTIPGPDPTDTDPGPDPTDTDPGPDPTDTDPGPDPTDTDPGPDPTDTDPGPEPTDTDPGPEPTDTDPGPTSKPSPGPSPSPTISSYLVNSQAIIIALLLLLF